LICLLASRRVYLAMLTNISTLHISRFPLIGEEFQLLRVEALLESRFFLYRLSKFDMFCEIYGVVSLISSDFRKQQGPVY